MTIIGICGCTALILAGFGLRDSISNMLPLQYESIYEYQTEVTLKDDLNTEEKEEEYVRISKLDNVNQIHKLNMQSGKVMHNGLEEDVQISTTFDSENLNEFINLRNRITKEEYKLDNNSIILTEKLAKLLEVKEGENVILKNSDDMEKEVKVSKITENYISHYVYMTKELYDSLYEENLSYNMILIKTQDGKSDETLAKNILESDMASKVGLTSTVADMLDETMDNFDYVVIVLIVSAGLLAFVVLYNLSNVNISERIRELATIKVLGFYDREVHKYISRETVILTVIGIVLRIDIRIFLEYIYNRNM